MSENRIQLPLRGRPKQDILAMMQALRQKDVKWREGKVFSLVFYAGDEVTDILKEAYLMFFSENGLNLTAFPSLRELETQVVAMVTSLLGGDEEVVDNMTSGGTESLLMAVKTAREWARAHRPEMQSPEMILPLTAHPAFEKAAHYFGVKPVHVPVRADFRADIEATKAAITPRTILMVGSAPSYPHGVIDPIAELADVAREHHLLFHVDACVGGLVLPFFLLYWVSQGDLAASVSLFGDKMVLDSVVLGLLLITAVVALPLWTWLSHRFSKRSAYIIAMSFWAVVQMLILTVRPGQVGLILVLAVLAGMSVSSAHVLPDAIFPNVLEWDELRTRQRREGIYYGTKNFVRKMAGALAIFLALQALGWFGYLSPPRGAALFQQSGPALTAIRIMTGPVGALLLCSAIVVAWFYPLTRERHARIRRLLARRRKIEAQHKTAGATAA